MLRLRVRLDTLAGMRTGLGRTCLFLLTIMLASDFVLLDSESLRSLISTEEGEVSVAEFSSWNRRIVGTCDAVRGDQYICEG